MINPDPTAAPKTCGTAVARKGRVSTHCQECGVSISVKLSAHKLGRGRYCGLSCASKAKIRARWGDDCGTDEANFNRHVIRNDDDHCWGWKGRTNIKGYGFFRLGGKKRFAHRASYELHHGPIPAGAVVMHRCDNPPCTNPRHLSVGSPADNNADKHKKGRHAFGTRNGKTHLTDEIVLEIRRQYASGKRKAEIARAFGLSWNGVDSIVSGRTWGHLLPQNETMEG